MAFPANECFEVQYESGAAASYLAVRTDAGQIVKGYQVEMIRNNNIEYIIPFDVRRKDDKVSFYYNITSRLPLSQYLKRKKLKKGELLKILGDISRVLLDCKCYLLNDRSVVLDSEYIFINPTTQVVSFVYIPVRLDADVSQNLREFIVNFILFSADMDESCKDNFFQRILWYAKSETFNVMEFDMLIKSLVRTQEAQPGIEGGDLLQQDSTAACEHEREQVRETREQKEAPGIILPKAAALFEKDKKVVHAEKCQVGLKVESRPLIMAAGFQLLIAAVLFLSFKYVESIGKGSNTNYGAIVLIAASVDILLLKKLFGRNAVSVKRKEGYALKKRRIELPGMESEEANRDRGDGRNEMLDLEPGDRIFPDQFPDTSVLEEVEGPDKKYPYLESKGGIFERITITSQDFVIGRLKEQADYVSDNTAIGKVHALITQRNSLYFIKDLNSRNGTFINGLRINSNIECEIRSEDKVSLANSDYTFIIP